MTSFVTVNYHYVRPIKNSKFPNLKGLEIKEFIKQINYLKNNYNIISGYDLINAILYKDKLPKKSCLLTFDDGYKDHYKYVMPELLKRKITGCFFPSAENILLSKVTETNKIHFILNTKKNMDIVNDIDFFLIKNNCKLPNKEKIYKKFEKKFKKRWDSKDVKYIKYLLQTWIPKNIREKCCNYLFKKYLGTDESIFSKKLYVSSNEINEMIKNGMVFGGHGYRHIRLAELSFDEQKKEVNKMLKFLKIFNIIENWIMCYPYGSFNKDTISILSKKKCVLGFAADYGKSYLNKKNLFKVNRFDTNDIYKKF